jgi:hypothetical protein
MPKPVFAVTVTFTISLKNILTIKNTELPTMFNIQTYTRAVGDEADS